MVSRDAPDVQLELTNDMAFGQELVLANERNKQKFIECLSECLLASDVTAVPSTGDTDTDIMTTALQIADSGTTAVVYVDDTDVFLLC